MMVEQPKRYVENGNIVIWYLPSKGKYYYHRLDGPAYEGADGSTEWMLNNKWHREDGPAINHADGTKMWWLNGERHREDGPALEWADGTTWWYLNDNRLPKKEVESWLKENNIDLKTNDGKMAFKLRWS